MALEVSPKRNPVPSNQGNANPKLETTNNNVESSSRQSGNSGGKNNKNKKNQKKSQRPKVKCTIVELKDRYFDCTGYRQAEEYKKSKEALESYVSFHCKYVFFWRT